MPNTNFLSIQDFALSLRNPGVAPVDAGRSWIQLSLTKSEIVSSDIASREDDKPVTSVVAGARPLHAVRLKIKNILNGNSERSTTLNFLDSEFNPLMESSDFWIAGLNSPRDRLRHTQHMASDLYTISILRNQRDILEACIASHQ